MDISPKVKNKLKETEIIEEDKKNGLLDKLKKGKESNNSPYLEPSEVEQRIRDIIYKGYLINIYSWFHKQSVSYKNLDENERVDFDIETIQGEVKIKSIIENKLNLVLKILDLNNIDKTKMKEIELIIEANFDKNKKKLLEEEKKRKELSRNAKAKLKRAFKFARLVSKKYPDKTLKEINTEGDEISKFKIRQKAEKDLEEKSNKIINKNKGKENVKKYKRIISEQIKNNPLKKSKSNKNAYNLISNKSTVKIKQSNSKKKIKSDKNLNIINLSKIDKKMKHQKYHYMYIH